MHSIWFFYTGLLFAVFGFCCAVWLACDWLFSSKRISVAVEIKNEKDADMLDMLLHEARSAFFKKQSVRPVVLVASELMNGVMGMGDELYERYAEVLDRFGAECYVID